MEMDRTALALSSTISAWKSAAISRDNGSSEISLLRRERMATKLRAELDVHGQPIRTVTGTVKIKTPDTLAHRQDDLLAARGPCVFGRLARRLAGLSSRVIKRPTERSNWAFPQPLSFPQHTCAWLGVPLLPARAPRTGRSNVVARARPPGRLPLGRRGDGPSAPLPAFIDEALEDAHATA